MKLDAKMISEILADQAHHPPGSYSHQVWLRSIVVIDQVNELKGKHPVILSEDCEKPGNNIAQALE